MTNAQLSAVGSTALLDGDACPECGKQLDDDWNGVRACFCTWGGRAPTADEVADAAEAYDRPWH